MQLLCLEIPYGYTRISLTAETRWLSFIHPSFEAMPTASASARTVTCAVLVRSHNPLPGQLLRMREWATALIAAGIPMHVSVDVSHGREAVERVTEALSPLPVAIHIYDEEEMLREFPHIERLRLRMVGEDCWAGLSCPAAGTDARALAAIAAGTWRKWAGRNGTRPSSIAWGFHAEALCLWWRSVTRVPQESALQPGSLIPEHVWVLEDDVGFTAPLSELIDAYSESHADLITDTPQLSVPVSATSWAVTTEGEALHWTGWCWHDTCTEEYASLVPDECRFKTKEHAQRFSARLVEEMHRQCQAGCSAWSEQFACSLCLALARESLSHEEHGAARRWIVEPIWPSTLPPNPKEEYGPSGHVSEEAYRRMCTDTRGVLLHALKW